MKWVWDLFRAAAVAAAVMSVPHVATFVPQLDAKAPDTAIEVQNTGGPIMNPADQVSVIQWALKEGGSFAVILVILFFYRRDWKTAVEFWRDQHAMTTDLVVKSTQAQTETAAALRENTVVVHQVKGVMQKYLPERRDV